MTGEGIPQAATMMMSGTSIASAMRAARRRMGIEDGPEPRPNEKRLSCAAVLWCSQTQFYYDGRRQLQPPVRLRAIPAQRSTNLNGYRRPLNWAAACGAKPIAPEPTSALTLENRNWVFVGGRIAA